MPVERADQIGRFFLSRRTSTAPWKISWYEGRQTRGISTGERNLVRARVALAEHALRHDDPVAHDPRDVTLDSVLADYYLEHGRQIASLETVRASMRRWVEYFPESHIADLTIGKQLKFVRSMIDAGLSHDTVVRTLNVGKAAINRAYRAERLSRPVRIGTTKDFPDIDWTFGERTRVLTAVELAALFDAAGDTERYWRLLLVLCATACRPAAATDLQRSQLDTEHRIVHLNPDGRRQTNKRRPTIPMAQTLCEHARSWGPGPVLHYEGRKLKGHRKAIEKIVKRAGLDGEVTAYTVRHTVTTWLAKSGVSAEQPEIFTGHRMTGSATTAKYIHLEPGWMQPAADAVDALLLEVSRHCKMWPPVRVELEEQPVPEDASARVTAIE